MHSNTDPITARRSFSNQARSAGDAMVPTSSLLHDALKPNASSKSQLLMEALISVAMTTLVAQFDAFSGRLLNGLIGASKIPGDIKRANLYFEAANLLKNNQYAFFHLAVARIRADYQHEVNALVHDNSAKPLRDDNDLGLVPLDVMDYRVAIGNLARPFNTKQADQLGALQLRLAVVLGREKISLAENPFRPQLLVSSIYAAWKEFHPDSQAHPLILALLEPSLFFDLSMIFRGLNEALIEQEILPDLGSNYRSGKFEGNPGATTREAEAAAVRQKFKALFAPQAVGTSVQQIPDHAGAQDHQDRVSHARKVAASKRLRHYLATLPGGAETGTAGLTLQYIRQQIPAGALNRVDETTIDLLVEVFDSVFQNPHIPLPIKDLIGDLQVPVLRAALADEEFFYQETHPARQLIELLSWSGIGWDQSRGVTDPRYQTIKRTIDRVQQPCSSGKTCIEFARAVSDLQSYLLEEEESTTGALEAPISKALHVEKMCHATASAKQDISVRIGTGELVPFVETFLENRWLQVMTLAHSIAEEKPDVLHSAIKTMDDLLWSVKPKLSPDHRKELITRLPSILAMLNKWLNVIKWDDAEREKFFADLAECHASLVRAPLDLSPARQLEIALEAARTAAERRTQIVAKAIPEPEPDEYAAEVHSLQRGTWLAFEQPDGSALRVKLAWTSPRRTLYIFSNGQREEAFSLSDEQLADHLREGTAELLQIDGLFDRAMAKAMQRGEPEQVAEVSVDD